MHLALTLSLVLRLVGFGNALPRSTIGGKDDTLGFAHTSSAISDLPALHGSLAKKDNPITGIKPRFPASGKWLDVSCQDAQTNNLELSFEKQWETADGSTAWDQAMKAFEDDPNPTHLAFDAWLSNSFYSAQVPRCGVLDASTKCTMGDCDATWRPAGAMIRNSLVGLNIMATVSNIAMQQAKVTVQGKMDSFQKAFTKLPSKLGVEIAKMILDTLLIGIAAGSAYGWNVMATKTSTFAKNSDWRGAWKDWMNAAIAYGINMPKDSMKKSTSAETGALAMLKEIVGHYMDQSSYVLSSWTEEVMKASDQSSRDYLTQVVKSGVGYQFNLWQNSANSMQPAAEKLFYARMIPVAWSLSTEAMNPFILRIDHSEYRCGDSKVPSFLSEWLESDVLLKTQWCDPHGNTWLLLNAKYGKAEAVCRHSGVQYGSTGTCKTIKIGIVFEALAGGDTETLNGDEENWRGITLEDIFRSSWGGFVANDMKNGYAMKHDTSLQLSTDMSKISKGEAPLIGEIQTPGFFNLTICFDPEEAVTNILAGKKPVCGEEPKGASSGWCKVHVTQYKKDAGAANPLDKYQLSVTIFDAFDSPIRVATKQPSDKTLRIKSSLPYPLLVNDDDPDAICFWYNNQWWCSHDSDHQCKQGDWDGPSKTRNIDCGFRCNFTDQPGSPPRPAPTNQVDAFDGVGTPHTFANAKTYHHGSCHLYIRQYQQNEKENGLNLGTYALELTLKDDKKELISYTEKTNAHPGVNVNIQGPLEWLVQCHSGSEDSDPVTCSYGRDRWDLGKVKFEHGFRDLKSTFDC